MLVLLEAKECNVLSFSEDRFRQRRQRNVQTASWSPKIEYLFAGGYSKTLNKNLSMSDAYTGEIRFVAFTFDPYGWMSCDGRTVNISEYGVLYSVIGTTYGGDGVQHFNLPKLNGRGLVGSGKNSITNSEYTVGQKGGAERVALSTSTMPQHFHTASFTITSPFGAQASILVNSDKATQVSPAGAMLAPSYGSGRTPVPINTYASPSASTCTLFGVSASGTPNGKVNVDATGANNPVPISLIPPLLVGRYIICYRGIFPDRP